MARGYIGTVAGIGGIATAVCILAILATSPVGIGPLGVTVWFLAVFVAISCWIALGSFLLEKRLHRVGEEVLRASALRRGLLGGGFLTVLLGLSSLRQLGPRDVLLMAILLALIELYAVTRR